MKCSKCQTENPEQAKFCLECGTKVNIPEMAGMDFDKLTPVVANESERRLATILFADLVGYTSLAETMDPEEVHALLDLIFSQFEKVIKEKGGFVDRLIGDALIGVFGIPHASESDSDNAVQAAIQMRSELKKISLSYSHELSIRVGVNSGEILWGSVAGGDSSVWGDTVNVAQRLQTAASINSIIISQSTKRRLKQGYRLNQIASLKLKGKEQFVQAYEVVGLEDIELPSAVPFVGRKEQLEVLQQSIEKTISDKKPSLVLLTGEAGVGKSRLLEEFNGFIKNAPHEFKIFTERCLPHAQLPYDPLSGIIRHYLDLTNLSLADAQKRLAKEVARLLPDSPLAHHFLGFFLGMKYPESPLEELTPDAARTSAFNILKRVLERVSHDVSSLIITIEDLQWGDIGTKDFLKYLNDTASNCAVMVIATVRMQENITEYINQVRENIRSVSESRWKLVELAPFSKELTKQFIGSLVKNPKISSRFVDELWIKTGGNPLFLEELLRGLIEESAFDKSAEGGVMSLPENVWQIIESRVDRLSETEKKTIKVASVFGRIFWEKGLEQCLQQPVRETLLQLESRGFIVRDTDSLYRNDSEYSFRHELIRDVCYRMLLKRDRTNYHHIVFDFLQGKRNSNELSEELYLKLGSYHAEESNELKIAIEFYEKYGDYENNRYMLDESLWVYRKAQELADKAESKDDPSTKVRLIEKEAGIYYNLSRYNEAVARYEKLRIEPPHWSWRVKGLLGIAEVREKQSDYEASFRYAGEAAEIAFHGKNNYLLGKSLNLVALSLIGKGLYGGASKLAERVKASFTQAMTEPEISTQQLSQIKKELANSFNNIGLVYWYQGEYDSAMSAYESALSVMQEINNRYGIAASHINIGNIRRDQGNYQSAQDYYQKSLTTSQMIGSRRGMAVALLNIGAIYHDKGDYQKAHEYFNQSLSLSREINARREETVALTSIGNLYHDQGEYGRALKTHLESLPLKRQLAEKTELVIALLNIATLFFERGDYGEAAPLIDEAEQIVNQVKAKMEIITSLNTMGRMLVYFALMGGLPGTSKALLFNKAKDYVQNALKMAKALNLKTQTLEAITSLALLNVQESVSNADSQPKTTADKQNGDIFFREAYKLLKEAEALLPYIYNKESQIHYYFAYARYYLEVINYLGKKKKDDTVAREIEQSVQEVTKITTQALNITQELGLKRLQPEAMFLYVQALSASGEKDKAANYYENCRQLAEMMGLKPFLRMTARMPV
jgi:class 3 adenylate cyclase/predicted ATPase